jgi:hypothetical protein
MSTSGSIPRDDMVLLLATDEISPYTFSAFLTPAAEVWLEPECSNPCSKRIQVWLQRGLF